LLVKPRQNVEGNAAAAVQLDNSLRQIWITAEKQIGFSPLPIMGQPILNFESAAMNAEQDAVAGEDQCGLRFRALGAPNRSSLNADSASLNKPPKNLKSLATPPKNKSLATTATCLALVQAALRGCPTGLIVT
jgi:hypothetical protein